MGVGGLDKQAGHMEDGRVEYVTGAEGHVVEQVGDGGLDVEDGMIEQVTGAEDEPVDHVGAGHGGHGLGLKEKVGEEGSSDGTAPDSAYLQGI